AGLVICADGKPGLRSRRPEWWRGGCLSRRFGGLGPLRTKPDCGPGAPASPRNKRPSLCGKHIQYCQNRRSVRNTTNLRPGERRQVCAFLLQATGNTAASFLSSRLSDHMSTVLPALGLIRAERSSWSPLAGCMTGATFLTADCLAVFTAYAATVLLRIVTGG